MPAPYSVDFREKIVECYLNSIQTYEEIAERFNIGSATVKRFVALSRKTGDLSPQKPPGRPSPLSNGAFDFIASLIDSTPEVTLQEICDHVSEHGFGRVSQNRMSEICTKLNIRRKKASYYATEIDSEQNKKKEVSS